MNTVTRDTLRLVYDYLPYVDKCRIRTVASVFDRAFQYLPGEDGMTICRNMDKMLYQFGELQEKIAQYTFIFTALCTGRENTPEFRRWFITKLCEAANKQISAGKFRVNEKDPPLIDCAKMIEELMNEQPKHSLF